MRLYVICYLLMLLSIPAQAATAVTNPTVGTHREIENSRFKSFREWKKVMVSSAEMQLKQSSAAIALKQRLSASAASDPNMAAKENTESGLHFHLQELQKQAEKDQYQLSITKDLTISDYFVGYLIKQRDMSAAITEVSGRLTPEEIAELMAAYANNFFSSRPPPSTATSRSGLQQ